MSGASIDLDDVTYLDVETDRGGKLLAVGAVRGERYVVGAPDRATLLRVAELCGSGAVGGHNVAAFDLPLLARAGFRVEAPVVDTLVLAMLADPARASHALEKDRAPGALPDPVADARGSRDLARACAATLAALDPDAAAFYAAELRAAGHAGAALVVDSGREPALPEGVLGRLCRVHLRAIEASIGHPDEHLSLALAVRFVETSGVVIEGEEARLGRPAGPRLAMLPRFGEMVTRLLGPLCPDPTCEYRQQCAVHRPLAEDILARNFELPAFRPNQREIVEAVLGGRTPLAILPTGGGKSLCYQLPAVHGAERLRGLTVVISPLQALMADQVRSLSQRYPGACFVNSSLLLGERQEALAGVRSGRYDILYIGPEQLRNPSMSRLFAARPPFLWVIDEAHCISQWGHGFRTDYTYLPRAIARIHGERRLPLVALFTATATREVIDDVRSQLESKLGVAPEVMDFGARRDNLAFEVVHVADEAEKDRELLNLLAAAPGGTRLVYCATVRTAGEVAAMLRERDIPCALYHGKLAPREKKEELERFLAGRVRTVVATSAFGMGIDKPDIRLVVHHDLPGSVEDYVQEAGRAARDGAPARCVLLFSEDDLDTQFFLKTAGRVTAREVRTVFKALKARTRRLWRGPDGKVDLWVNPDELLVEEHLESELDWSEEVVQQKLKLVLYHLERDGVLERLENRTRVFGLRPLMASVDLAEAELPQPPSPATLRVLRYLYDPERPRLISILDVADECGLGPAEAFREIQALADRKLIGQDLAFDVTLARGVPRSSSDLAKRWFDLAEALWSLGEDLDEAPVVELRAAAARLGRELGAPVAPHEVFQLLRALRQQGLLRLAKAGPSRYRVRFEPGFVAARDRLRATRRTAEAVMGWLDRHVVGSSGRDVRVELDVGRFLGEERRLTESFSAEGVVDACLLLHHLEAWHLSDPPVLFDVSLKVRFDPAKTLKDLHAERADQQHAHDLSLVHLLREYAVIAPDRREGYLDDYFRLPRGELLDRYFRGRKRAVERPVGPHTEERLLEGLTAAQRDAATATDRALLVVAGPGSGKTHTLVRRIAHMIRARQIRPQEILVLAFNRAAAAELRRRLEAVLGRRAAFLDVRTFHSLALKLTGDDLRDDAADSEERLAGAMDSAARLLEGDPDEQDPEETRRRVLGPVRHVLVDEYQDLDASQYRLLAALVGLDQKSTHGDRTERSVFVVGDDDQAVYGFRNASVEFLRRFEQEFSARRVCLVDNFRSDARIVAASSAFIARNPDRMKQKDDEQVRPAPYAPPGDERSVRRFRYPDRRQLPAHIEHIIDKTPDQSVAVLSRHWSGLDGSRFLLERRGIPFVLHHREHHRPVHRRHPAARILRKLWKDEARVLDGPAVDAIRALVEDAKRGLDEPSILELLAMAAEIDAERAASARAFAASGENLALAPISTLELADALLLASRDAALRGQSAAGDARVHLSTFHGAKGLEFDKVLVLPARPAKDVPLEEERRAFYVALTRARRELAVLTLGAPGELALEVDAPEIEVKPRALRRAAAAYLDASPKDVVLASRDLARAQRVIAGLREGDALELDTSGERARLTSQGELVCVLSTAGSARLARALERGGPDVSARVREIYVHLRRDGGAVKGTSLVVLPTIRASAGG